MIEVHFLRAEEAHSLLGVAGTCSFPKERPLILNGHESVQALAAAVGRAAIIGLMHIGHSLDVPVGTDRAALVVTGANIQVSSLIEPILRKREVMDENRTLGHPLHMQYKVSGEGQDFFFCRPSVTGS